MAQSHKVLAARPHLALAVAVAAIVACEAGYRWRVSLAWLLLEGAFGLAALAVAWITRERLRLMPLLGLTVALHSASCSSISGSARRRTSTR